MNVPEGCQMIVAQRCTPEKPCTSMFVAPVYKRKTEKITTTTAAGGSSSSSSSSSSRRYRKIFGKRSIEAAAYQIFEGSSIPVKCTHIWSYARFYATFSRGKGMVKEGETRVRVIIFNVSESNYQFFGGKSRFSNDGKVIPPAAIP